MRKSIIICFCLFMSLSAFCADKKVDVANFDFFGIKMSYSYNDVIKELEKEKKDFFISKFTVLNKVYYRLQPKNQNIPEKENLDFEIGIYDNKILGFIKFNVSTSFKDYLIEMFGKENEFKSIGKMSYFTWIFDNFKLSYGYRTDKQDNIGSVNILNLKVQKQYEDDIKKRDSQPTNE